MDADVAIAAVEAEVVAVDAVAADVELTIAAPTTAKLA